MQKADIVLSILSEQSRRDANRIFDRLYRNLFNADFYIKAYQKMYAKQGNMTPGTDDETIDGFNYGVIEEIIQQMKAERYYPKPVRRTHIPKKSGGTRPLGIPTFRDKLVQEVVRQILEAIYEPLFSDNSHGFRSNRSCQTALHQIKTTCKGTNWVIEGDIKGCFDNIDHTIMLQILSKKIKDGRFIELIRRFLKCGYMEWTEVRYSLSGTPQGQIASPILANIYLHEFDTFVQQLIVDNTKGIAKRKNPEYRRLTDHRWRANQKGDYEKAEAILQQMRKLPSVIADPNYMRLHYVRYADDWIICINGSKETALRLKEQIASFLKETLKLTLSESKTLITCLNDRNVSFLGYEISKSRCNTQITENSFGVKRRAANETIQLLVPASVVKEKLRPFMKNGKSVHHNARINLPVLDIISQYNAEMRGLYNYYCLATDVSTKLGKFKYYHYFSLAKTIARKEKSSVKKVINKYGLPVPLKQGTGTRNVIGIKYETKKGEKTLTYFTERLTKKNLPNRSLSDIYYVPRRNGTQLIHRLNACECELCGITSENPGDFEVHHIRKLKDIKEKYAKRGTNLPAWHLRMCSMNRKTLIVCSKCHKQIHNGTMQKKERGSNPTQEQLESRIH